MSSDDKVQQLLERLFQACLQYVEGMASFTWTGGGEIDDEKPEDNYLELHISEALAELMGGADDGAEVYNGYTVHITSILKMLEASGKPASVSFCCDVGITRSNPELAMDGHWEGIDVIIYFHAEPRTDDIARRVYQDGSVELLEPEDDETP